MSNENIYLVVCGKHIDQYCPERELADMAWDVTVQHIAEGQFETLVKVIEIGTGADVTEKIARDVVGRWALNSEPLWRQQLEFIEQHLSIQEANTFRRRAG